MLVVEVKGGGVAYDPSSGRWASVDRNGVRHDIKDPFRQATAEKHALIQILLNDARWRKAQPGRVLAGHAVFDFVLPHALALSCEATSLRYDAIVIDEGQDFKEEYWLGIEWLLRDGDSSLYVFYDQNQALYTRAKSMPIHDEPFVLTVNCRNTKAIHTSAYRFFSGVETDAPPGNDGVPVDALPGANLRAQASKVHAAVVELISRQGLEPNQIAVLVCGEPKQEFYSLLQGLPLPGGSQWITEGAAADQGVRLDTVRRFKGLEADVVYLWGVDTVPQQLERETLYVGISRAKSRLTVVGTSTGCERALALGLSGVEVQAVKSAS